MKRIKLYEEYRLIERDEIEVNGAWKGAHLILFFLAFVFGCACTFSFHILMYLFDEKCVLFPKLLSLRNIKTSLEGHKHEDYKKNDLPVDFVSTQWRESSTCYLPTYVPLVSGIFGLVWTTLFFMCSSGTRTMTGLQRPWRILPPIFIFSCAMGGLSIYSSYITHAGLQDLCEKLSEITGSKTCAYIVNIVTLAYERRIRGVYQATQLTILTAWAHTTCWILAAAVALARVLLVIDFRLVRIQAELQGDIEAMLEHYERHIKTISPETISKSGVTDTRVGTVNSSTSSDSTDSVKLAAKLANRNLLNLSVDSIKVRFLNKTFNTDIDTDSEIKINTEPTEKMYYISSMKEHHSDLSLVPAEAERISKSHAYRSYKKDRRFIMDMVYDLLNRIDYTSESNVIRIHIRKYLKENSTADYSSAFKPEPGFSRASSSNTTLRPKKKSVKVLTTSQKSKEVNSENKAKQGHNSRKYSAIPHLKEREQKRKEIRRDIQKRAADTSVVPLATTSKSAPGQTAKSPIGDGAVKQKSNSVRTDSYEDVKPKKSAVRSDSAPPKTSWTPSRSDITLASERTLIPTDKDKKVSRIRASDTSILIPTDKDQTIVRIRASDTSIPREKENNEAQTTKKEKQD